MLLKNLSILVLWTIVSLSIGRVNLHYIDIYVAKAVFSLSEEFVMMN